MGVQEVLDMILIRHSFVRTARRRTGIGCGLLRFHLARARRRVLVGCLKVLTGAIALYQ
jgi:hypothetical protein